MLMRPLPNPPHYRYDLSKPPWGTVLWRPVQRQMLTQVKQQKCLLHISSHYAGFRRYVDIAELRRDYQISIGQDHASLPDFRRATPMGGRATANDA